MPRPYASGIVPASADAVWQVVKQYNGLPGWLPAITASEIEGGESGQEVGAVRRLTLGEMGQVTEVLLTMDDADRSYTYEFVDTGPFPVRSYRATIRVAPITTTGQAFVEWWAWFDSDAEHEKELTDTYSNQVYAAGIAGLVKHFGG
ncbi:MAG: SRPBCC family protein [Pseudonocardia sp.]|nr:SRPBCC family protein [Pseudonocardia sp.]